MLGELTYGLIALGVLAVVAALWLLRSEKRTPKEAASPAEKTKAIKEKLGAQVRRVSSSDEPELPRLGDDGDEIEVTLVTISPAIGSEDAPEISIQYESAAGPPPDGSSVEVAYEDEAEKEKVTPPISRILIHAIAETAQCKLR